MTRTPATPAPPPQAGGPESGGPESGGPESGSPGSGGGDELRGLIAGSLLTARERTRLLTESVDDSELVRQHSPLMSPLVWDLAHIANQEELWLLRNVGGRAPGRPAPGCPAPGRRPGGAGPGWQACAS